RVLSDAPPEIPLAFPYYPLASGDTPDPGIFSPTAKREGSQEFLLTLMPKGTPQVFRKAAAEV
ncbi:MAG: hypothetical protein PHD32_10900, partial [Eubacteriales bacterium]|nr:hypothetical protein [Eubacteriales bacterium]